MQPKKFLVLCLEKKIERKKTFQFSGIGKIMAKQNSRWGTNRFPLKAFFPFFRSGSRHFITTGSTEHPFQALTVVSVFIRFFFRVNWEQCMHRLSQSHVNPMIRTDLCPVFVFDPFAGKFMASETN